MAMNQKSVDPTEHTHRYFREIDLKHCLSTSLLLVLREVCFSIFQSDKGAQDSLKL